MQHTVISTVGMFIAVWCSNLDSTISINSLIALAFYGRLTLANGRHGKLGLGKEPPRRRR